MKQLICIVCPKGCHLTIDEDNNYTVTGNTCMRGADYAKKEVTHPTRTITSTIRIHKGTQARVSVKTASDISKEMITTIMERLSQLDVEAPVHRGMVVETNICGSGADLLITKDVARNKKEEE